jgi:WD40 repeat protein
VQVVRPQREFAPQAMEPWRLPRDRDDPTPRPEDAPPLKRFLASPTGNVLVWDDEGCAWVWNTALPPSSTRHLGLAKSRGVLAAAWIDGRTVLLAVADGELLTTELPAMPRDLMRPWQTILKADTTVRALAARLQGMDLLLAVGTDKNIRIIVPGKDVRVEPVTAPVLCLQYLTNGTLIATTQTAIRVWLPNGQETSFALNEPCAVAVSAWVAPCVAVVPAGRKDEIQILNLDLDANKGGCTTASRLCEGEVVCLALSADGKLLIAGSKAGELVLMNGAPWKVVAKAKPHTGAVRAVEFNHDGAKVYSADNSGQIYVWNIAGQKP